MLSKAEPQKNRRAIKLTPQYDDGCQRRERLMLVFRGVSGVQGRHSQVSTSVCIAACPRHYVPKSMMDNDDVGWSGCFPCRLGMCLKALAVV